MAGKRFNSLFFQAVIVLILISIIPVFIIGFHVLGVDSRILKKEILQKQQSVARRILFVASSTLTYQEQLLAVFLDLHAKSEEHTSFTLNDLNYLRSSTSSFLQVAVLNTSGEVLLSAGSQLESTLQTVVPDMVATCLQRRPYISDVFRSNNRLFVWLAEPFQQADENEISGILAVAYDLTELGSTLLQTYPLDMNVAFVSAGGELISYNGAPGGLALHPNSAVEQKIQQINKHEETF